jgi:NADH dehydrogenase/NADH:ubiquinone oxidoreductase subunit G
MSKVQLQIDGVEVEAEEGMTVLQAAFKAGVKVPTLCQHGLLEPYGACRLCMVELDYGDWSKLVASCCFPVAGDLVVKTNTDKIRRIRKTILELLLAHAPDSPELLAYGKEYGADENRFSPDASFCIHCGLCVRYCDEVKKANAVGFVDRGVRREIAFIPEVAAKECWNCKECFPLCPTSALQAAYVLAQALMPPQAGQEAAQEK